MDWISEESYMKETLCVSCVAVVVKELDYRAEG